MTSQSEYATNLSENFLKATLSPHAKVLAVLSVQSFINRIYTCYGINNTEKTSIKCIWPCEIKQEMYYKAGNFGTIRDTAN